MKRRRGSFDFAALGLEKKAGMETAGHARHRLRLMGRDIVV